MLLQSRKYNVFQKVKFRSQQKQKKTCQNACLAFTHKTNEIINIVQNAKHAPFDFDTNIPAKIKKKTQISDTNKDPKYSPRTPRGPPPGTPRPLGARFRDKSQSIDQPINRSLSPSISRSINQSKSQKWTLEPTFYLKGTNGFPKTLKISGNFAGTSSNDLRASSTRQPMVTGGRAQCLQYNVYNIIW